jgi:hypothetical protein
MGVRSEGGHSSLLADTSGDVARSFATSDLLALSGVGLDNGGLADTEFVASGLSDTGLGGSGQSLTTDFAGSNESASVGAALAVVVALLDAVDNAVTAEG